jgi:16S rRNA (adenine1518-N6/adenine1519-N6)-dimethyltransferase
MKPKKSLGQNFLKDKSVLDRIIQSANLSVDDFVVEVGPGEGVLTEKLIRHVGKVLAIEIDKNLAENLDKRFSGNKKLEIINDDILKINLPELIKSLPHPVRSKFLGKNSTDRPLPKGEVENVAYKIVANIPYYITSPIIQLFLETKYPPREMILMVQKEVAKRICAKPGAMSILAVSVQYYAKAELLFYVDKKAFWPVPEVDSAVIRINPFPHPVRSKFLGKNLTDRPLPRGEVESKKFFRIVRAGFSSKRKTLLNNLSSSFHLEKSETEEKLKKAGIDPGSRAQELTIEDWKKISPLF